MDVENLLSPGFRTATDMDRVTDLNDLLVRNKPATSIMRVSGNSMTNANIYDGDIIIVDRSIKPQSGKIVIAVIEGEMLIRRLEKKMNKVSLIPGNPKLSPIEISEYTELQVWGVVTYIIRNA